MSRWIGILGLVGVVGCFAPPKKPDQLTPPPKTQESWRRQTVALTIRGFDFVGDNVRAVTWSGTGVFVTPDILVTNAHVAARALEIQGTDDLGNKHQFSGLVALDLANDLALLRAKTPTTTVPKRASSAPRARDILAVGNTAGLGLSVYEGSIHHIIDDRIVHSARISSGASGGPLYDHEASMLYGINHACDFQKNTSIAIPAWIVDKLLLDAKGREDIPLEDAFVLDASASLHEGRPTRVCIEAGATHQWVLPLSNGLDLLVDLTPERPDIRWRFQITYDADAQTTLDLGTFRGRLRRAHTTPRAAVYTISVSNPASSTACVRAQVGQIDWGAKQDPQEAP